MTRERASHLRRRRRLDVSGFAPKAVDETERDVRRACPRGSPRLPASRAARRSRRRRPPRIHRTGRTMQFNARTTPQTVEGPTRSVSVVACRPRRWSMPSPRCSAVLTSSVSVPAANLNRPDRGASRTPPARRRGLERVEGGRAFHSSRPQRGEPQRGEPQRGEPQRGEPRRGGPQRGEPQRGEPQRGGPQRGEPQRANLGGANLSGADLSGANLAGRTSAGRTSARRTSARRTSAGRTSAGRTSAGRNWLKPI